MSGIDIGSAGGSLGGPVVHRDSAVSEPHYRTDLGWMTEVVGAGETIQLRCRSITLAGDDLYI